MVLWCRVRNTSWSLNVTTSNVYSEYTVTSYAAKNLGVDDRLVQFVLRDTRMEDASEYYKASKPVIEDCERICGDIEYLLNVTYISRHWRDELRDVLEGTYQHG